MEAGRILAENTLVRRDLLLVLMFCLFVCVYFAVIMIPWAKESDPMFSKDKWHTKDRKDIDNRLDRGK